MSRHALLVALVVALAARRAAALCDAGQVIALFGCGSTTCTVSSDVQVTPAAGAACLFDFGSRDVSLVGGGFVGHSGSYEIRAHTLTVGSGGKLTATGGTANPGGVVTLTLGDGGLVILSTASAIDVSGGAAGAGLFQAQTDGDVTIGHTIVADGTTTGAMGGSILVTAGRLAGTAVAASGSISVAAVLDASTASSSKSSGGTVALTAIGGPGSGNVDVENRLDVTGGTLGGGAITISATGDVVLGRAAGTSRLLFADGGGDAGDGGSVDVFAAGAVRSPAGGTGPISAVGHSAAAAANPGGLGGEVSLEARDGGVALAGGDVAHGGVGGIRADSSPGSCGGSITVTTDASQAPITVGVPLSATGPGTSGAGSTVSDGAGGSICVDADGVTTVTHLVDASGGGGGGGMVEIDAGTDLSISAAVRADSTADPGCLMFNVGGNATIGAILSAANKPTASVDGPGGTISLLTGGAIDLSGTIDGSGTGGNGGGCLDLEAGSDVTVEAAAEVDADGGTAQGAVGGDLCLVAGSPELPGDLVVNGSVHARGVSPTVTPAALVSLSGCAVQIGPGGVVDSSGDAHASTQIAARKSVTVSGQVKATGGADPKARNALTLPIGATVPASGFSPPLAPTDVTALPFCASATDRNCLLACPQCGNGAVEFPETCDAPPGSVCCDATCRTKFCADAVPCTADDCAEPTGCTHTPIPGCTTTTTTLRPTTTTLFVTTTTLATTTTTLATTTTSTAPAGTSTTTTSSLLPTTTITTTSTVASPSSTTTTTGAPATSTTLPGCLGDGVRCDDGDDCTADHCGADGICVFDPIGGIDGALCRLGKLANLIRTTGATPLGGPRAEARLRRQVDQLHTRVAAATVGGRRGAKMLARARTQLGAFVRAVDRGEHAGKIGHELASELRALALGAQGDITPGT